MTQKLFCYLSTVLSSLIYKSLDKVKPKTEYVSFYFNSTCVADVMVLA